MSISQREYWDEVKSINESLLDEYKAEGADTDPNEWLSDRIHETVDSHQWIIYNAYHLPILEHASNAEAYVDNFGEMPRVDTVSDMHTQLAFEAFREDINNEIDWDAFQRAYDGDDDED